MCDITLTVNTPEGRKEGKGEEKEKKKKMQRERREGSRGERNTGSLFVFGESDIGLVFSIRLEVPEVTTIYRNPVCYRDVD